MPIEIATLHPRQDEAPVCQGTTRSDVAKAAEFLRQAAQMVEALARDDEMDSALLAEATNAATKASADLVWRVVAWLSRSDCEGGVQ